MGPRAGLDGINDYHYYFKTVILSVIQRERQLLRLQSEAKTVLLKIFSVILTRLYEHEPFGTLFTFHDSVYKEHQQQRISDCWNEITHTHTHTHTPEAMDRGGVALALYKI